MYRHFLVPMDDTDLSIANCNEAVDLATRLQARITFMHVVADYAATGEGALFYTMDPAVFARERQGKAAPILAKACAAAQAAKVPHDTYMSVGDRAVDAVLEAVRHCGCDLIVMASHGMGGLRSLLARSHTAKVLERSSVAVLVTRVQANDPNANAVKAVALIQDEHRSFAAVLRGMLHLVEQARGGEPLRRTALLQMMQYVLTFPEQLHHPHEERYLHPLVRRLGTRATALLDRLEREHQFEYALVAELHRVVADCPDAVSGEHPALLTVSQHLDEFAQAVWQHMGAEESELLPLARAHLTEAQWAEVARGFESHRHPRLEALPAEEFGHLFSAIATMLALPKAPSPH